MPKASPRKITRISGITRTTMEKFCTYEPSFTPRRFSAVKNKIMRIAMVLIAMSLMGATPLKAVTAAIAKAAIEPEPVRRKPQKPLIKPKSGP